MVVPDQLATKAIVPDPLRIRITDLPKMRSLGRLGESGLRLAAAGVEFYFTREMAQELVDQKVAVLC